MVEASFRIRECHIYFRKCDFLCFMFIHQHHLIKMTLKWRTEFHIQYVHQERNVKSTSMKNVL